jgi:hypothetical protein
VTAPDRDDAHGETDLARWCRHRTAERGFAFLVVVGMLGYWFLGHARWTLDECAYMTVITMSP